MKKITTATHEWILTSDDTAIVGIMQDAVLELGEIVYVELPKIGAMVKKGQEVAVLESTKAAVDVYSPVSGKIVDVNKALLGDIGLINQKSETEGWLYKVLLDMPVAS